MSSTPFSPQSSTGKVSRRGFIAGASTAAAGAALVACSSNEEVAADGIKVENSKFDPIYLKKQKVEFDGPHQAGIATPAPAFVNLVAFTVRAGVNIDGIRNLMRLWTDDARRLCSGEVPLGDLEPEMATTPANLTITCGYGPRLFDIIGKPDQKPEWLHAIPAFSKDKLDEKWGEADLVLQLCCDDPTSLSHATRAMIRGAVDYVETRWMQQGFLHVKGAGTGTPRNLFGQIDGTVNPHTEEEQNDQIWIDEGPEWVKGGSCMVVRRIAMNLDTWEILDRMSRELSMGRTLDTGAPLSGEKEFDVPDFEKTDEFGLPVIDPMSHIARAHNPADKPKEKLLRRAYNYDLPPEPGKEETSNAGLIFICFQKNPDEQFTPIQRRLDEGDRLNQWITHIGSAVFAMVPGVDKDSADRAFWGQKLLEG